MAWRVVRLITRVTWAVGELIVPVCRKRGSIGMCRISGRGGRSLVDTALVTPKSVALPRGNITLISSVGILHRPRPRTGYAHLIPAHMVRLLRVHALVLEVGVGEAGLVRVERAGTGAGVETRMGVLLLMRRMLLEMLGLMLREMLELMLGLKLRLRLMLLVLRVGLMLMLLLLLMQCLVMWRLGLGQVRAGRMLVLWITGETAAAAAASLERDRRCGGVVYRGVSWRRGLGRWRGRRGG